MFDKIEKKKYNKNKVDILPILGNIGSILKKGGIRLRKLPDVLTNEEREALLKQPNKKAITGLRNLCIITLMLNAGLRVSEVLHLRPGHIDFMRGKITIKEGKGSKDRILWVGEEDLQLLQEWQERRPAGEYFFCNLKGGQLIDRYIRQLVKRLGKKAGINKDVYPHLLRHTFATDLLRQTKNIRIVQKALGHSDISTTAIYTHIIDDEMEEALKFFRSEAGAA